jgi:hypothetical protein
MLQRPMAEGIYYSRNQNTRQVGRFTMTEEYDKGKPMALPENSKGNYRLAIDEASGKLTFAFPEKAEMTHGKCEFKTHEELLKYIAKSVKAGSDSNNLRGSIRRKGKYQKVDKSGNPVLTIGDPILDLISDDEARVFIGSEAIYLTTTEFSSARYRSGGIRSIDLSGVSGALAQSQLLAAARGEGDFVLVESSDRVVSFASTNPSQRDFYPTSGGHIRFKAWKKNYYFYWSMGAEIETWGGNFKSASIESTYLDTFYAQTCFTVKRDSDSDTNDDYVDEYEWGVNAPQPKRVESVCNALFKNQQFVGRVDAGPQCFVVGSTQF